MGNLSTYGIDPADRVKRLGQLVYLTSELC